MNKYSCSLLCLGIFLAGCRQKDSFVQVYELNGQRVTEFNVTGMPEDSENLKLSQLSPQLKVIPLQTTDEALIEGRAKYYAGDSCILVFQSENVLMFGPDGRFIRVVARKGKGPHEFVWVNTYAVDEKNNWVYLSEFFSGSLKKYHLKDSTYFEKVVTAGDKMHNSFACLDNGDLLLVPFPVKQSKYLLYTQNVEGELKEYLPGHADGKGMVPTPLLYSVDNVFHYMVLGKGCQECDTVYTLSAEGPNLKWVFKNTGLRKYIWKGESPGYLFFRIDFIQNKESEIVEGEEREATTIIPGEFYYDKVKQALYRGYILDDFLSGYALVDNYRIQDGHRLCIVYPASELMRQKAQPDFTVHSKKYPGWKEIPEALTEEDNPVLVIGEL